MGVFSGLSLYWPELTGDELRGVLVELEDWVQWARVASRRLDDVLRECWPLHPGVVHQLAAWQAWWWAIYRPRLSGDRPPARGAHSGQAAVAWWDSLERGLPRLAEEFRSCRPGSCRRVRDSRPGWVEAFASGDVAHQVIERMLETDWQGWFPSWPREPEDDDPAAGEGA